MDKIGKVETLLTSIQRIEENVVQEDFQRLPDGTGVLTVSAHPDEEPWAPTRWLPTNWSSTSRSWSDPHATDDGPAPTAVTVPSRGSAAAT